MNTPAKDAGFVVGKRYKVKPTETDHHLLRPGEIVEFSEDDGSLLPFFTRVWDGKVVSAKITRFELTAEAETPVATPEPAPVHVSLNGNSTTIVVQRNLTADEVAAVLKAINAA